MKIIGFACNAAVIFTAILVSNMQPAGADTIAVVHANELTKYINDKSVEFKKEKVEALKNDIKTIDNILSKKTIDAALQKNETKPYIVMRYFKYNDINLDDGWAEIDRYKTANEAREVRNDIISKLRSIGSNEAVTIHVEIL